MKRLLSFLPTLALFAFTFTPNLVRAQDAPPPPDMGDQGAPPPPDQGGPGPDQGPPPDQGQPADNGQDDGADPGVSYQTFYDNLSDQGTWVQTDDYGYVFQPNVTDPNWAPYSDGHWVYTEDGWTWVSDEPWGWATYHYGRWANIDGTGWVWIPGYRWAPAWVSWRFGGGYCGWAPLPPDGVNFGRGGYHYGGDVDVSFHIGAGLYNFVPVGRMGDPNMRGAIVNRYNNYGIINRTTNITNININGGRGRSGFGGVVANGPSLNTINAHASRPVPTMRLAASNTPGRASVQGNSLAVFAPRVNSTTGQQARPASVGRNIGRSTFNRGDSISRPLAVTSSVRPAAPSAELIQNARQAQAHVPASAKIATTHTPVHSVNANAFAPATTTHTNAAVGGTTYHPQVESNAQTYHPATTPSTTYHPQAQSTYHPEAQEAAPVKHYEAPSSSVYHAPSQSTGQAFHPQSQAATSYHPESQHSSGGGGAPTHTEMHTASVVHPAAAPGGGGGNHPSGGGGGGGKPAGKPAPADAKKP